MITQIYPWWQCKQWKQELLLSKQWEILNMIHSRFEQRLEFYPYIFPQEKASTLMQRLNHKHENILLDTMLHTTLYLWYMTSIEYVKLIDQSKRKFLKTKDLDSLIGAVPRRTLEDIVKRLVNGKILNQLEKGKYQVANMPSSDFDKAQFLYSPSYISFETALNYHGILSQFPLEITSATTKRRVSKLVNDKTFSYAKLNPKLFTGYYKEDDFLIASPEKALFDQLYMITRSVKTEEYLDEMDYSQVDVKEVDKYAELVEDSTKNKISNLLKRHI